MSERKWKSHEMSEPCIATHSHRERCDRMTSRASIIKVSIKQFILMDRGQEHDRTNQVFAARTYLPSSISTSIALQSCGVWRAMSFHWRQTRISWPGESIPKIGGREG